MQADTTGLGIIVLAALTERQWVEEDEFARSLNLPPKMVRKAVRYLEEVRCVLCWGCKAEVAGAATAAADGPARFAQGGSQGCID